MAGYIHNLLEYNHIVVVEVAVVEEGPEGHYMRVDIHMRKVLDVLQVVEGMDKQLEEMVEGIYNQKVEEGHIHYYCKQVEVVVVVEVVGVDILDNMDGI